MANQDFIVDLEKTNLNDIERVGGKNASLGEMIQHLTKAGVQVPLGFATTAHAYRAFLAQNGLANKINELISKLDINDVSKLAKAGAQIRQWIIETPFLLAFESAVKTAYMELKKQAGTDIAVAVRSSATAEDLPDASFAGQQETFLNVVGLENVLSSIKHVFASLYTDRAITYRKHHGFDHEKVALSAGVQLMVRSDKASSGVMFTIDTETGFEDVIFITSSYGLGEPIVQGAVNPDEFYVYKPNLRANRPAILRRHLGSKLLKMINVDNNPEHNSTVTTVQVSEHERHLFSLNDDEITFLARQALLIEEHYKRPMDIEWAKDGVTGKIYILQARPETVKSRKTASQRIDRYQLKTSSKVIVSGRSIGQKIGCGPARVMQDLSAMKEMKNGDVLIADMTDPDWEPIMKRASAIVTNRGGRTCHAAIIARELGIPAVVGCGDVTQKIKTGDLVTVSCAQGETGYVYEGLLEFDIHHDDIENIPELPVKIMLNLGNPEHAFAMRNIANKGVGLARLEFMISQGIGIHPKALLNFEHLNEDLQQLIREKTACYKSPVDYYVEKLVEGMAMIAAAFYPKPVIVRLSDFKSNEYANLLGGHAFEPNEENPMLGFRGASRYVSKLFSDCFALECQAVKKVRDEMSLTNLEVMIPFVRTVKEAQDVVTELAEHGLKRGKNNLRLIMMCEIPSNALLADKFLEYFDGFSIGSNDLTQLTLGLDRDSGIIAEKFDERDAAVKSLLHMAIQACKKANKYIGICGQGPSDHPDFAQWLLSEGIESMSLNPDSVMNTILYLAKNKPKPSL